MRVTIGRTIGDEGRRPVRVNGWNVGVVRKTPRGWRYVYWGLFVTHTTLNDVKVHALRIYTGKK